MSPNQSTELMEFESAVNLIYDKAKNKNMNYYELLGVPKTATHKEIESAFKKYSLEFSESRAKALTDFEMQKKAHFLAELGKRAYEVLIDFEKRLQYEKLGFRDVDPESLKEMDSAEKAREIYKKSKNLYLQKNYPLAAKAMQEALVYDSTKPEYYQLLGLCQTQIPEKRRDAEVNLKKALELESWNAEHVVALGMLFYTEKLYKRAEGYFRQALEIEPRHELANKKLKELLGPEATTMDKVQGVLGKVLPSLFGKKKK